MSVISNVGDKVVVGVIDGIGDQLGSLFGTGVDSKVVAVVVVDGAVSLQMVLIVFANEVGSDGVSAIVSNLTVMQILLAISCILTNATKSDKHGYD